MHEITGAFCVSCFAVTLIPDCCVWLYIEYLFLYCLLCYMLGKMKNPKKYWQDFCTDLFLLLLIFYYWQYFFLCNGFYTVPIICKNVLIKEEKNTKAAYAWYLCIMLTDMCLLTYCIMMFWWAVTDHAAPMSGAGFLKWPFVRKPLISEIKMDTKICIALTTTVIYNICWK